MFRHFSRLISLRIVFRFHIVPWKFAQPDQSEPGSETSENSAMPQLYFPKVGIWLFTISMKISHASSCCGPLFVRAKPPCWANDSFDMYWIFKTFVFHPDIIKERGFSPSVCNENLFHLSDTKTCYLTKSFTPRNLMKKFQSILGITEFSSRPPVLSLLRIPFS